MREIHPRKSVYELKFFPILEHVFVEAEAAKARKNLAFLDWAKTPSTVILMEKKLRERVVFESGKISVELDRIQTADKKRVGELRSSMTEAMLGLKPEKLLRVGLREWFAIPVEGSSEQQIFRKLRDRIFRKDSLEMGLGALPQDMGIVFEWDTCKTWYKRRVEFGVMPRSEWLQRVPYFEFAEKQGNVEKKWIDGIEDSLPPEFLFIDVDTFWLANPPEGEPPTKDIDIEEFFDTIESRNADVAKRLFELIRN